ncbi:MAG: hypothetical protein ACYCRD_09850 [Leptospirillum sp.]
MATPAVFILTGFFLILTGSALFSRSAERLVSRLFQGHPRGMRILAILSLSLPEALLPLIAFWTPASSRPDGAAGQNLDIGVGAILGAPSFLLLVLWPLYLYRTRKEGPVRSGQLQKEIPVLLLALTVGLSAGLSHNRLLHLLAGCALMVLFAWVLIRIRPDSGENDDNEKPDVFRPVIDSGLFLLSSALIVAGPRLFLSGLFSFQHIFPGAMPFWISMILSALATESPEALALFMFLRSGKISLGFDVVWGSISFQLTVPLAIGLFFSPWVLTSRHLSIGGILLGVLLASLAFKRKSA